MVGRLVGRERDGLEARPNLGNFGNGEMVGGKLLGGMTVGVQVEWWLVDVVGGGGTKREAGFGDVGGGMTNWQ